MINPGSEITSRIHQELPSFAKKFISDHELVTPLRLAFLSSYTSRNMPSGEERLPSIVYGPRAPVPLTLTFGQLLDHHAEERPDSPAAISHVQNCTVTYRQLRDRSVDLAKSLSHAGIGKGSLVGIILATRYEYMEVRLSII